MITLFNFTEQHVHNAAIASLFLISRTVQQYQSFPEESRMKESQEYVHFATKHSVVVNVYVVELKMPTQKHFHDPRVVD